MNDGLSSQLHRQVYRLINCGTVGTLSDAELLDRFIARRDEAAEAAFEELVNRHAPMVLQVCQDILRNSHDAEDAFQAVFLVLASRAGSIRRPASIASWLFGVARRAAAPAFGEVPLVDETSIVASQSERPRATWLTRAITIRRSSTKRSSACPSDSAPL